MVRHNVNLADRVCSVPIMVSADVFALGLPPLRYTVGAMLLLGADSFRERQPVRLLDHEILRRDESRGKGTGDLQRDTWFGH